MEDLTLSYLLQRTASQAIGPSTLRNQGATGVVKAARCYLSEVDLSRITKTVCNFPSELDSITEELRQSLPQGAQHFGTARKSINIFLRDCLYNKYINSHYKLDRFLTILEVPLDSHVAFGLRKTSFRKDLPVWDAIIRLNPSDSNMYQEYASTIAKKLGCNRVDLDIYLWRKIGINVIQNI